MTQTFQAQDLSSNHKYRTELPNIIFELGLSPYEFALYCLYKKIAGDQGYCFRRGKTLAKEVGISERSLREVKKTLCAPRPELDGLSLITITPRFKPGTKERDTDVVTINDIWPVNYQKLSMSGTKCLTPPAPHAGGPAPRAEKEDPYKKNPLEETPDASASPPLAHSADAERVVCFLLKQLKEKNPQYKEPTESKLEKWKKEVDLTMRRDSRKADDLISVLKWAFERDDDFWPTAIQSPQTLRRLFDRAWSKMNHKSKAEKQKEEESKKEKLIAENKKWAEKIIKPIQFPSWDQKMVVDEHYVAIRNRGELLPVGYTEKNFKNIIINKLKAWQLRIGE
jgi:hypothetical protein